MYVLPFWDDFVDFDPFKVKMSEKKRTCSEFLHKTWFRLDGSKSNEHTGHATQVLMKGWINNKIAKNKVMWKISVQMESPANNDWRHSSTSYAILVLSSEKIEKELKITRSFDDIFGFSCRFHVKHSNAVCFFKLFCTSWI